MFPQVFGKFVLEGELSAGGMARVFLATLRGAGGFEKRLVVKQIRPELASDARFVERFVGEAKTSVELNHPNIVPVYELGVEAGVYYIAMELCPGVTLAELLSTEGALSPEEGAYVGVELARALGYAHRRAGIVHRDVTPRNVLIDDEGAVRLIDFGIAEPVTPGGAEQEVFGTPGHMPPEQIRGQRLTPAADVFALGALLYECLSGRAAFRRASQEESLRAVLTPPPALGSARLGALDGTLAACFAERPEKRPRDMDEVGRVMRDFLREADVDDVARGLGRRVRRVRRASLADARREQLIAETAQRGTAPLASPTRESQLSRTFATRPLAAGERAPAAQRSRSQARRARSRWLVVGGLAAAVALAFLMRALSPASSQSGGAQSVASSAQLPEAVKSAAAPAAAAVPSSAPSVVAALPAPVPSAPEPPAALASAPRAASAGTEHAPSASASSRPTAQKRGVVALTASPSAQVSIAGRSFETPVMHLELPEGSYRATFRSPTWDGGLSVSVEVSEAVPRSVHADFTSQPPRVVVR